MPSDGSGDSSGTTTGSSGNTGLGSGGSSSLNSGSSSGSFWGGARPTGAGGITPGTTYGTITPGTGNGGITNPASDPSAGSGTTLTGGLNTSLAGPTNGVNPVVPNSGGGQSFAQRHPFLNALAQFGVTVVASMLGVPPAVAAMGYQATMKWASENPSLVTDPAAFSSVMDAAKPVGASNGAGWASQSQITSIINAAGGGAAANPGTTSGGAAPAAPGTPASLGQQALDFAMQQYADGKAARDKAAMTADEVAQAQLAAQKQQTAIAADYDNYNKTTFRPLEQKIVADAQGYDTAARRAEAVSGATSDVEQAFARSNAGNERALRRSGVSTGSGRMQALMADQTIAKANSIAGATTGAVRNVETIGAARMADAANLGRNLPSAQATAAATGINAGNSAVSSGAAGVNATNSGVAGVNNGFSSAISGATASGQLYNQAQQINNQAQQYEDNSKNAIWGAVGNALGSYLGGLKDGGPVRAGRMARKLQDGGRVSGPGGPRDDKVLAHLSNNEHVIDAAAVRGIGGGDYEKGHVRLNAMRRIARQQHAQGSA